MKLFRVKSVKYEAAPVKLCFGVPLDQQSTQIPSIVEKCTSWLNRHATTTEGVFRLSPNHATLDELTAKFDKGENVDLEAPMTLTTSAGKTTAMVDAHSVAGLLKKWFRELPEPLCTMEMYDMWMAAATINDPPTKMTQVKKVLSFCPPANQRLIKYLARFLYAFSAHSSVTKMTSANLSICFAPNLLRAPDTIGLADQIEESPIATSLLVMFIENFADIFGEAPSEASSPAGSSPTSPPMSPTAFAKKSSLTANLPPPPAPSNSNGAAPAVTTKKPMPKYMPAGKKVGGLAKSASGNSLPSAPSPPPDFTASVISRDFSSSSPVSSGLSSSSSSSSFNMSAELPPPLLSFVSPGPPPVAAKPKGLERKVFRQSAKITGSPTLTESPTSSAPSLPPPPEPSNMSSYSPSLSNGLAETSIPPANWLSSPSPQKTPPARPRSAAPTFARNLSSDSH